MSFIDNLRGALGPTMIGGVKLPQQQPQGVPKDIDKPSVGSRDVPPETNDIIAGGPWNISSFSLEKYDKINSEMDDVLAGATNIEVLMGLGKKEAANRAMYALLEKYGSNDRWGGMLDTLATNMDYRDPTFDDSKIVRDDATEALSKATGGLYDVWKTRSAVNGIKNHIQTVRNAWDKAHTV